MRNFVLFFVRRKMSIVRFEEKLLQHLRYGCRNRNFLGCIKASNIIDLIRIVRLRERTDRYKEI